jgi:hypothetical protein
LLLSHFNLIYNKENESQLRRLLLAYRKSAARTHVLRSAGLAVTSVRSNPVLMMAGPMGKAASVAAKRYMLAVVGGWKRFPHLLRSIRQPRNVARGWIGVDLDGTLAQYHGWKGLDQIGPPVPVMLERVKTWLDEGVDVRIFTARVCRRTKRRVATRAIGDWCERNGLPRLPVTNTKDFHMIELWDDRAVRVETNVGRRADERVQTGRRRRGAKTPPSLLIPAAGLLTSTIKAKQKMPRATWRPGVS